MPQCTIPFLSLIPYTHIPELTVGVTHPNSWSYTYLPCLLISLIDSLERYGVTNSNALFISSSSVFSSGAPASPSTQQPPLHFARSQTKYSSTISSLIRT